MYIAYTFLNHHFYIILYYHTSPVIYITTAEITFPFWQYPHTHFSASFPSIIPNSNGFCWSQDSTEISTLCLISLFSLSFYQPSLFTIPFTFANPILGFYSWNVFHLRKIPSQHLLWYDSILIHSSAAPLSSFVPSYFICIVFSTAGMHCM